MKKIICFAIAIAFSFSAFAQLTLKETQEFFARQKQLREPPAVDIYQLWQKAGIEPEPLREGRDGFLFGYQVGEEKKFLLTSPETKLYSSPQAKIIRIEGASTDYQFLIFQKEDNEWVYLDYLYNLWEKYRKPEVTFLDDKLFYIGELTSSGTGVSAYRNNLCQIKDNQLIHLASLPDRGHVSGWGQMFIRRYSSDLDYSNKALTVNYTVEIDANTYYYEPKHFEKNKTFPLFEAKRKAVFLHTDNGLEINPQNSQLTKKDMDNLFSGAGRAYYSMFKEEFDRLKEGSPKEQEWYREFR